MLKIRREIVRPLTMQKIMVITEFIFPAIGNLFFLFHDLNEVPYMVFALQFLYHPKNAKINIKKTRELNQEIYSNIHTTGLHIFAKVRTIILVISTLQKN